MCRPSIRPAIACTLLIALSTPSLLAGDGLYRRGDCNSDTAIDIADVVFHLSFLFSGGDAPACDDACDTNDDGTLDISDAVYELSSSFTAGPSPAWPHLVPGVDLTADLLDCDATPYPTPYLSVCAGDVTTTSAVVWVHTAAIGPVDIAVASDAEFEMIVATSSLEIEAADRPMIATLSALEPGTAYFYRAVDAQGAAAGGRFRTAHASDVFAGLHFGVSGDWRGELAPYPSIANAPEAQLDFFLVLGDTIYADYPSPAVPLAQATTLSEFRAKHSEVYADNALGTNPLRALRTATAIFATTDDHEVTDNYAGGAHPSTDPRFPYTTESFINETMLYQNGMLAFEEYNPLVPAVYGATGDPRTEGKPKFYRARTFGRDAALIILDARSFRDTPLTPVLDPTDLGAVADFLIAAADPSRTMLGQAQLDDLESDLLTAQNAGVTWKLIAMPEPIQNLGVVLAEDRYEGYAAERAQLLEFIDANAIDNVVFLSADIHGSIVNNLTYAPALGDPQIATNAFELTTGSVAFDAPFGQTVIALVAAAGLLTPEELDFYESAMSMDVRDQFLEDLVNNQMQVLGYDTIGLAGSPIQADLIEGLYTRVHGYGWTEFDIDATTQQLTVTIWGVEAYTETEITSDPTVVEREPQVLTRFVVTPQ